MIDTPGFTKDYEANHYPLINEEVHLCNNVLRKFGPISVFDSEEELEGIYQPGIVHFNAHGHRFVASRLAEMIKASLNVIAAKIIRPNGTVPTNGPRMHAREIAV